MKDAVYSSKREVRTFAELHHASNVLLQTALEHVKGNRYTVMSSLLLRAFAFEAYLNHLGERHLNLWDATTERLAWHEKFGMVCNGINFKPDVSQRPYQTLKRLFRFRNALAHGKSETITAGGETRSDRDPKLALCWPTTHWEKYCTLKNAQRAQADIMAIIEDLHARVGLKGRPFDPPATEVTLTLKKLPT